MRVASVPAGHDYVRHLSDPDVDDGVRRLPDPPVPGAPAGRWWPSPMLEPHWVRAHAGGFDVFHLHFGYDDRTPAQLRELVAALREVSRPLVLTAHDLRNPHHLDPAPHAAALDVLVPAADAIVTLTPSAAEEIAARWGRRAQVIPHPHVVPPDVLRAPRPVHDGFVAGVHAKSLRANSDPVAVARVLAAATADLPGARVRFDAHDDAAGRAAAAQAERIGGIDVRVHAPFTDDELWAYLSGLDVSVLPYRFGTHSGWLEACYDLGTTVLAPTCGYYAEQAPCLNYGHDESGLDAASLTDALRTAHRLRPRWRADPSARASQRRAGAAAHRALYARARTRVLGRAG